MLEVILGPLQGRSFQLPGHGNFIVGRGKEFFGHDRLAAVVPARPMWEQLGRAAGRLEADGRHLGALGPRAVLRRGYAVVTAGDGSVLRDAAAVAVGDRIGVGLAAGSLVARVEEVAAGGAAVAGADVAVAGADAAAASGRGPLSAGAIGENGVDGTRD